MAINQEIIIFGVLFCVNLEVHNLTFPKNIKISIFKKNRVGPFYFVSDDMQYFN